MVVGWRGDSAMDVYLWPQGRCEVAAFDAHGNRYCAAAVDTRVPGWQHTLLRKLRDGDWQLGPALFEQVQADNARLEAARAAEGADRRLETADKLHFALLRDLGHMHSGTTRRIY